MRSPRGFLGAILILLALPIAVLIQVLFGSGSETTVHFVLAAGSALVAFSAFDFETPRWIAWIGCVSASALAAIFLAQGVGQLVGNDSLNHFLYQVLGSWPEGALITLLVLWLVAILLSASQGKTRILGLVALAIVVGLEVFRYVLLYLGTNLLLETPALKLLSLLPLVWLLLETRKRRLGEISSALASAV
jgi:hypothetical protein